MTRGRSNDGRIAPVSNAVAMPQSTDSNSPREKIPIFLLKTKSAAGDAYEDLFSAPRDGFEFAPTFVPVLEHRFLDDGLDEIRDHLRGKKIAKSPGGLYGGLIFTSQRAVEAFSKLIQDEPESGKSCHPPSHVCASVATCT